MRAAAVYAHRLGRAYGPDSSAAALRGALAAGVDGLETDVCLTADGALSCCTIRTCRSARTSRASRMSALRASSGGPGSGTARAA